MKTLHSYHCAVI